LNVGTVAAGPHWDGGIASLKAVRCEAHYTDKHSSAEKVEEET